MEDPEGRVAATLRENDAFRGWVPQMPLMMFHHKSDDCVPFENAQEALQAFTAAGAPRVSLVPFSVRIGGDSVHSGAAPAAYLLSLAWLNYMARK